MTSTFSGCLGRHGMMILSGANKNPKKKEENTFDNAFFYSISLPLHLQ